MDGLRAHCSPGSPRDSVDWQGNPSRVQRPMSVTVKTITFHPECELESIEHQLCELRTFSAMLTVTRTHRVMVRRGQQTQPILASAIAEGEDVIVGENLEGQPIVEQILQNEPVVANTRTADIQFSPDRPVLAFHPPLTPIQSRGSMVTGTRRGRRSMYHRHQRGLQQAYPNTSDSDTALPVELSSLI